MPVGRGPDADDTGLPSAWREDREGEGSDSGPAADDTPPGDAGAEEPPMPPRRHARRARATSDRYVWAGAAVAAIIALVLGFRWLNGEETLARYHHYQDLTARQCYALPRVYLQGCLYGAALQLSDAPARAETTAERRALFAAYAGGELFPRSRCVLLPTDSVEGCIERATGR